MNGQTKQTPHDIYIGTSFLFHISIMKLKIGIIGPKVMCWCEYLERFLNHIMRVKIMICCIECLHAFGTFTYNIKPQNFAVDGMCNSFLKTHLFLSLQ